MMLMMMMMMMMMEKAKKSSQSRVSLSRLTSTTKKKKERERFRKAGLRPPRLEWNQGAFINAEQFFPRVNAENGVVRRVLRARQHSSSLIINVEKFVSKKNTEEYRETLEIIHIKYSRWVRS